MAFGLEIAAVLQEFSLPRTVPARQRSGPFRESLRFDPRVGADLHLPVEINVPASQPKVSQNGMVGAVEYANQLLGPFLCPRLWGGEVVWG